MAKNKKEAKTELKEQVEKAPEAKYKYLCPACSNTAIETSNKMLDVSVNCQSCAALIRLDDPKRYVRL